MTATAARLSIVEATRDPMLFRSYLADAAGSLGSWRAWLKVMRLVYGVPLKATPENRRFVKQVTGRRLAAMPADGFRTALFLTGRRCGKSRVSGLVGAFEAALSGGEAKLAPGERGLVAVIAPTKQQAGIVRGYVRGAFDSSDMLKAEVVAETRSGFELRNGVRIEILAGDFRTVRGYTLLCACIDEAAFLGVDAEAKVKSDTELIRAIRPALATVQGRLLVISSPYAKRGYCWEQYKRCFGNDVASTLVVNAPSRAFNPTLSQAFVDAALAEDPAGARAEFLGEFRDDVGAFVSRELVEALVSRGLRERVTVPGRSYYAFCDISGGRVDDAALALAHREDRAVVIDKLCRYRPPFDPREVIRRMCEELKRWGVRFVSGDNYSAEFVGAAFREFGVTYHRCRKNKSELYLELLPRLCSGEVRLVDEPALVDQLCSLERRTISGGKDKVDHPHGGHDDLSNAFAGVVEAAVTPRVRFGTF